MHFCCISYSLKLFYNIKKEKSSEFFMKHFRRMYMWKENI